MRQQKKTTGDTELTKEGWWHSYCTPVAKHAVVKQEQSERAICYPNDKSNGNVIIDQLIFRVRHDIDKALHSPQPPIPSHNAMNSDTNTNTKVVSHHDAISHHAPLKV